MTIIERQMESQDRCILRRNVTVAHISDTHNLYPNVESMQPADILIHTGDFTSNGTIEEFHRFNSFLGEIKHLYAVIIVVIGNHDHCGEFKDDIDYERMRLLLPNATYVPEMERLIIMGLNIVVFPWKRTRYIKSMMQWLCAQRNVDILASHVPGRGVLDLCDNGLRCGLKQLKGAIISMVPKCHLFGHVHEDYGYQKNGILKVLSVNSALCDHPVTKITNRGHLILFTVTKTVDFHLQETVESEVKGIISM